MKYCLRPIVIAMISLLCMPAAASLAAPATNAARQQSPPTAPASQPAINLVRLDGPKFNLAKHEFSIPAAFWNEHLASWLDVAICGRPSNFLHETVLSIQTTRSILRQAFSRIGYVGGDKWAPNLSEFTRIRGQPLLILVRIGGKRPQTFLLNELMSLRQWNIALGPFGWLYMGTPGLAPAPPGAKQFKPGEMVSPDTILFDDPQVAMQFRGIQHASQSLVDHPLCFDNWIYPNIRYFRNTAVLPLKTFNSNGAVPVKVVFRRVSEIEYLQAAIKYWHDAAFKPVIQHELPQAGRIDAARRKLHHLLQHHNAWASPKCQKLIAQIQAGYAALDDAWISWAAAHAKFGPGSAADIARIKKQAYLFVLHLNQNRLRYDFLAQAAQAAASLAHLKRQGVSAQTEEVKSLKSAQLMAQSKALLEGNLQHLAYWQRRSAKLKPNDPRKMWRRDINAELNLALRRQSLANAGIAYAKAMNAAGPIASPQKKYLLAVLRVQQAEQEVDLVNLDFQIINEQGFAPKAQVNKLLARKAAVKKQIAAIVGQINALK
ncbi:MAG: hypothetical protein HKL96_08330 [Phycisphaerales bacterium]|nr:hypothetical protein [Phycisphaerales bacterium]